MTAQFPDTVHYKEQEWSIVSKSGFPLFDPHSYSLEPVVFMTACHRGFICKYVVDREGLFLDELIIGLSPLEVLRMKAGRGYKLNDTVATLHPQLQQPYYRNIQLRIAFQGGLLIGKGFIQTYLPRGFPQVHHYENVLEIGFEGGKLVRCMDHSEKVAQLRDTFPEKEPFTGWASEHSSFFQEFKDAMWYDYWSK